MTVTDADRAKAFECWADSDPQEAIAQALADEREPALAGRLLYAKLRVTEPGMVIYDGTELRWTSDAQAVDGAGEAR